MNKFIYIYYMKLINNDYLLLTLFLCILVIYLILPLPKIIFKLHNNKVLNIKEEECKK
jgi:hypothetical protein